MPPSTPQAHTDAMSLRAILDDRPWGRHRPLVVELREATTALNEADLAKDAAADAADEAEEALEAAFADLRAAAQRFGFARDAVVANGIAA